MIKIDRTISSASFPLKGNEKIDLNKAFLELKSFFNCREVFHNEPFFLLCVKLEGVTVNISYKGKLKFFSALPVENIEKLYWDLWESVFKKCIEKRR